MADMISVYARLNTQNGSYQPHDVNHTESEPNQNNPYNRGDSMILRFHMPTIARDSDFVISKYWRVLNGRIKPKSRVFLFDEKSAELRRTRTLHYFEIFLSNSEPYLIDIK